ncbi:MAG: hypothetical protein U1F09_09630 [Steroidobacteraceae bacterium]
MRGILGLLGASLAGWAGWWLGAKVGFTTAILLSAVASGVGMYAGYRWFDQNLK